MFVPVRTSLTAFRAASVTGCGPPPQLMAAAFWELGEQSLVQSPTAGPGLAAAGAYPGPWEVPQSPTEPEFLSPPSCTSPPTLGQEYV